MKYPTAEETMAILEHNGIYLCTGFSDNPNVEAARVLIAYIRERQYSPGMAAVCGFLIGRAIGKREERQRRRGCGSSKCEGYPPTQEVEAASARDRVASSLHTGDSLT